MRADHKQVLLAAGHPQRLHAARESLDRGVPGTRHRLGDKRAAAVPRGDERRAGAGAERDQR
ncbi:MAG: hypothetical protein ACRDNJ_07135, partial [Solirubrobacteraceae bacterium]